MTLLGTTSYKKSTPPSFGTRPYSTLSTLLPRGSYLLYIILLLYNILLFYDTLRYSPILR